MSERTSLTTVNTALRDEAYTRALSMGTLKDLETEIDRRHASMKNAFEQMGDECKISAITEFGDKTPAQITESFIALHSEMAGYRDALTERNEVQRHKNDILQEREQAAETTPAPTQQMARNIGSPAEPFALEGFGRAITPSELLWHNLAAQNITTPEQLRQQAQRANGVEFNMTPQESSVVLNAVFKRTAGWNPQIVREGGWVDSPQRPPQVIDIIPTRPTTQSGVTLMLESTFTNAAVAEAEGTAIADSAFVLTPTTVKCEKYGTVLPVTEEQLEDVDEVNAYVNDRLPFAVMQSADAAVMSGTGTTPQIGGFYSYATTGSQVMGGETVGSNKNYPKDVLQSIFQATTRCRISGRARPTHAVMHPSVWEKAVLEELAANGYFFAGTPQGGYAPRVWGMPVVEFDAVALGKQTNAGLVGDFSMYSAIRVKRDLNVVIGYSGTDFTKDQMTYKATVRFALAVYRPKAFIKLVTTNNS